MNSPESLPPETRLRIEAANYLKGDPVCRYVTISIDRGIGYPPEMIVVRQPPLQANGSAINDCLNS